MRVQDFGYYDRPVALFGGLYSNLQATKSLSDVIKGMPAICTGDVVAYCADPNETAALARSSGWNIIAGNCERQLARGDDDCGCGYASGTVCDRLSADWWPYLRHTASAETVDWLDGLPDLGVFVADGRRYGVIHGGVLENNRFIWPSTPEDMLLSEIAKAEEVFGAIDGIVSGHSGIAFSRRVGKYHWINAGVVGLPPHDGRPETRYAILSEGEVIFNRLSYDHRAASEAMSNVGLTQGYNATLRTGFWPSEDNLPESLRSQALAKG